MKARAGYTLRNHANEYVLVPNEGTMSDHAMRLNEQAAFIWTKLQTPISRKVLVDDILNEYDTDEKTVLNDLDELLKKFKELGILDD